MAFAQKLIQIAIQLVPTGTNQPQTWAAGVGQGAGTNTVTLPALRTSVRIQNAGGVAGSEATVSVYGLTPSLMRQLSTLGMVLQMNTGNKITITAGDAGASMSTVFVGNIFSAYGEYSNAPNVPFQLKCYAGAAEAVIPFPASSYSGATDVAVILSAIASKNGWGFENNGVSAMIKNPYLSGSAIQQVRTIAEQVHINATLTNNTLVICPRYGARAGLGTPQIAPPPDGQMIGYPSYTQQGLALKTVFDPRLAIWGNVQVMSSIPEVASTVESAQPANGSTPVRDLGTWTVLKIDHALDSMVPKGKWESNLLVYNPKSPAPLPG